MRTPSSFGKYLYDAWPTLAEEVVAAIGAATGTKPFIQYASITTFAKTTVPGIWPDASSWDDPAVRADILKRIIARFAPTTPTVRSSADRGALARVRVLGADIINAMICSCGRCVASTKEGVERTMIAVLREQAGPDPQLWGRRDLAIAADGGGLGEGAYDVSLAADIEHLHEDLWQRDADAAYDQVGLHDQVLSHLGRLGLSRLTPDRESVYRIADETFACNSSAPDWPYVVARTAHRAWSRSSCQDDLKLAEEHAYCDTLAFCREAPEVYHQCLRQLLAAGVLSARSVKARSKHADPRPWHCTLFLKMAVLLAARRAAGAVPDAPPDGVALAALAVEATRQLVMDFGVPPSGWSHDGIGLAP